MKRNISIVYEKRESEEIQRKQSELEQLKERLKRNSVEISQLAVFVEDSINHINLLKHEHHASLVEAIITLEKIIANETDPDILLKKYGALSAMLQTTVLNNTSVQKKAEAMEYFLNVFKTPNSQFKSGVKLGVAISSVVLIIGLGIAASFIVPLIPFATAFAFLGLSGTALSVASASAGIVLQFGGVMGLSILLNKVNEAITNTLTSLFLGFTAECKAAKLLHTSINNNAFFAKEPLPVAAEMTEPAAVLLG